MLQFERWKITLITLTCLLGVFFVAPNFFSKETLEGMPSWLPSRQINLGLDLRGGSHLLLEVDVSALKRERLEAVVADARDALRENRIGYTGLGISEGHVTVRIRKPEDISAAIEAINGVSNTVGGNLFSGLPQQDLLVEDAGGGQIKVTLSEAAEFERAQQAVQQSIEIVRRRIDALGTTEPSIQRQGASRILVQVPGLDDPKRLKDVLGKTAKLTFRLVNIDMTAEQALAGRMPVGAEVLYTNDEVPVPILVDKRVIISGDELVDAQPSFDQRTNEPVVSFRFDRAGAKKFADVTSKNVGRPFAIILDNQVISYPRINEPITGGSGQISGNFTVQSANDLSILLRAGALPAPLTIIEERSVGPGLGADSIEAGEIAAIIGSAAVVLFILATYGLFGVFANIALTINIILLMGIMSLLQATLTLPGIAGIVLTIGMAVDANVLIYERMREEMVAGKGPIRSIELGYSNAMSTIIDANLTTLIAAIILFQLGSGPVRGFAVTLAIGIVTSVFSAVYVTRLMIYFWVRRQRPKTLPI